VSKQSFLANVRDQYEQYPYPLRDPEQESQRLIEIEIDNIELINFYCFAGKLKLQDACLLVAGGGTGDSTIFLAEQLRHSTASVIYVDISLASMEIAKQRAAKRNLTNIRWIHASLLALDEHDIPPIDYISCTGVLHHLAEPKKGLQALKSLLKPNGAMGIMLYATYGRTGVYQMQRLLSLANQQETKLADKISNTRTLLAKLPETNWFNHNQELINDHKNQADNGLVDLLLHEQDISYNIEQVHDLLSQCKLQMIEFSNVKMRQAYQPSMYVEDPVLLQKISALNLQQQQHIAELLAGAFKKHEFYVSQQGNTQADFFTLSNIPYFFPSLQYQNLGKTIADAMQANPNSVLPLSHKSGFAFDIKADHLNYLFFKYIDGINSLADIFQKLRQDANKQQFSDDELAHYFAPIYEQFRRLDWLLLKAPA